MKRSTNILELFVSFLTLIMMFTLAPMVVQAKNEPDYVRIHMSIDINRPVAHVWERVGKYCDIQEWAGLGCEVVSGDGGMGTVRSLLGGRILEIMVAQGQYSYGYNQPVVEGQFYNQYHGFMEAVAVDAKTTQMSYTLVYDASNLDAEAKATDMQRRRNTFENALAKMKELSESL
jgi:hypothetical protein